MESVFDLQIVLTVLVLGKDRQIANKQRPAAKEHSRHIKNIYNSSKIIAIWTQILIHGRDRQITDQQRRAAKDHSWYIRYVCI